LSHDRAPNLTLRAQIESQLTCKQLCHRFVIYWVIFPPSSLNILDYYEMGGVEFGFNVLDSGLVTARQTRQAALSLSSKGGGWVRGVGIWVGSITLGSGVSRMPVTAMQMSQRWVRVQGVSVGFDMLGSACEPMTTMHEPPDLP
jgi:hypothetical protein